MFKILLTPKLCQLELWMLAWWILTASRFHSVFFMYSFVSQSIKKTVSKRHDAFSVHHEWEDVIQPVKRITCAPLQTEWSAQPRWPHSLHIFITCTCMSWQDPSPDSLQRIFTPSIDCTNPAFYIDIIIFPLGQFYKPESNTLGQSTCEMERGGREERGGNDEKKSCRCFFVNTH